MLSVILLYALGGGVARYLGHDLDWGVYWFGQVWISVLQLSAHYLYAYYGSPEEVIVLVGRVDAVVGVHDVEGRLPSQLRWVPDSGGVGRGVGAGRQPKGEGKQARTGEPASPGRRLHRTAPAEGG